MTMCPSDTMPAKVFSNHAAAVLDVMELQKRMYRSGEDFTIAYLQEKTGWKYALRIGQAVFLRIETPQWKRSTGNT